MFDIHATRHVEYEVELGGRKVRVISRDVAVQIGVAGSRFGVAYRGPASVESAGDVLKIVDHVLMLRLALVALMLLGMTRRWLR